MRAALNLRNIGGFKGTRQFEFQRGVVNELEASNAIGKTSIIRGLGAVLSGELTHPEIIKEAENQGVLRESLKNIYEKDATVALSYDGHEEEWQMRSDGTFGGTKGDQRFLLSGMLTQEAKIIRQLVEGDSDFSWVTRLLSRAQWYAAAKAMVDSKLTTTEQEVAKILKKQETLLEEDKKLLEKKEEKTKLVQERDQLAQRLDEKKRAHIEKIKALEKQIDFRRERIAQYQGSISKSQQEIKYFQGRLESNEKNSKDVEKQLQSIDLDRINKEVIQNVSIIDKKLGTLRLEVAVLNGKKSTFADAKNVLAQRGETEGSCPVCEASTVTLVFLDEKMSHLNNDIREKEREIQALAAERTRWLQKEATTRREIDKFNQMIKELKNEERGLSSSKSRAESELSKAKGELQKIEHEQADLAEEKAELAKETEQWEAETHEALKRYERSVRTIDNEIAELTRKIRESSLEDIRDRRLSFDEAQNVWREYEKILSDYREYLDQRQHAHEVSAIADFNKNVRKVMSDLGFTEFDQIAIDKDDKHLKVFRSGFIRQPVESLSTSEKYSLAIVLQIALKQTYVPDIPFFIVDEVVVSYDGMRKEKILDYLDQMAKEESLYVIVTKLSEKAGEEISVKVRS